MSEKLLNHLRNTEDESNKLYGDPLLTDGYRVGTDFVTNQPIFKRRDEDLDEFSWRMEAGFY